MSEYSFKSTEMPDFRAQISGQRRSNNGHAAFWVTKGLKAIAIGVFL